MASRVLWIRIRRRQFHHQEQSIRWAGPAQTECVGDGYPVYTGGSGRTSTEYLPEGLILGNALVDARATQQLGEEDSHEGCAQVTLYGICKPMISWKIYFRSLHACDTESVVSYRFIIRC